MRPRSGIKRIIWKTSKSLMMSPPKFSDLRLIPWVKKIQGLRTAGIESSRGGAGLKIGKLSGSLYIYQRSTLQPFTSPPSLSKSPNTRLECLSVQKLNDFWEYSADSKPFSGMQSLKQVGRKPIKKKTQFRKQGIQQREMRGFPRIKAKESDRTTNHNMGLESNQSRLEQENKGFWK